MGVQICELNLDENGRELEPRGTLMFPCGVYSTDLAKNVTGDVPWHWHEEIELAVVRQGRTRVQLDGLETVLSEGEGIFINSNVLHSATIASPDGCVIQSLVFYPSLLSGSPESVFEQKYVRPLLSCQAIPGAALLSGVTWQREAAALIADAVHICEEGGYGFEWLVREKLSRLWYLLLTHLNLHSDSGQAVESRDSSRIKEMMNFITQSYGAPLTLKDIAASALISERECLRCFKRTLGTTPVQYLMKYRLSVAASRLAQTDLPVTEISTDCGFDSPSYFTQMFKRVFHQTPTDYRKALS